MYAFLLALGGVITAAGVVLLAAGVSIQQHTFDTSNITPAIIAIIGGCVLIGLAFVVRALLRVERALASRPILRPAAATPAGEPARTALPATAPKVPASWESPAASPPGTVAVAEAAPVEASRPLAVERPENAAAVEAANVSLLPKAPVRASERNGIVDQGAANGANGAGLIKTAPRVVESGRPRRPQPPAHSLVFDSLWPKAPRPAAEAPAAGAAQTLRQTSAPPVASSEPAATAEAPATAQVADAQQSAAAVSILKSGVVEGMAYTLYSDGSIEAQLPGGTVRFGSIVELRNHIEQNG